MDAEEGACTNACTSETDLCSDSPTDLSVDELAQAIHRLAPTERTRLIALLLRDASE